MQEHDAVDGGPGIAHDHGIGQRAQRGGDATLVARLHSQKRGHRADDADGLPRLKQGPGTIAAGERDAQCLESRRKRRALALALALLLAQRLHERIGLGQSRLGLLVLRVEAELAGIEASHLRLERSELALRGSRAGARILSLARDALDLGRSRLTPRPRRGHASRETSKALAAVGLRADALGHATLLLGEGALGIRADRRGLAERCPPGLDLAPQGELLLAQSRGLGLERIGVATARGLVLDFRTDEAQALR